MHNIRYQLGNSCSVDITNREREATMKNYYIILRVFTEFHNTNMPEVALIAIGNALAESFNELESWQQEMLQLTISFEVNEIICN